MRLLTKELETQFKEHSIETLADNLGESAILVRYYNTNNNWLVIAAEVVQDSWLLYCYHKTDDGYWKWGKHHLANLVADNTIVMDTATIEGESIHSYCAKYSVSQEIGFDMYCDKATEYFSKINTLSRFKTKLLTDKVKNNQLLKAYVLTEDTCGFVFYLDYYYDDFKSNNLCLLEHLVKLEQVFINNTIEIPPMVNLDVLNELGEKNVYPVLLNAEKNAQLIQECPHRLIEDLVLLYKLDLGSWNDSAISTVINNHVAELKGFSENNLFEICLNKFNPKTNFKFTTLSSLIGIDLPEDSFDMYVLTNETGCNGASCIISSKINELCEYVQDDLILLPSSIHEFIAIPKSFVGDDLDRLKLLVTEVNHTIVTEADFLSNNVYYYDKDTKTIKLV